MMTEERFRDTHKRSFGRKEPQGITKRQLILRRHFRLLQIVERSAKRKRNCIVVPLATVDRGLSWNNRVLA
jgi:hypothetical protein